MVYNIHILQTRKTGRVVAAAAASVLCCMGAVFPATIGVTAASADEPVELVVNGGFEDDLNGWKSGTVWNSSASSIAVTADDVHGGSGALSVTDRTSSDAGAIQSLDGKVEKGQTYTGSMWVKATEDGEFNITVCSGNGSGCDQIATGTAKAGEWTQISGTGTLGGSGDFTSPSLVIENKYGTSNADFIVDDIFRNRFGFWFLIRAADYGYGNGSQGFRRLFKPDYRLLVWRRSVGYGIQRTRIYLHYG